MLLYGESFAEAVCKAALKTVGIDVERILENPPNPYTDIEYGEAENLDPAIVERVNNIGKE